LRTTRAPATRPRVMEIGRADQLMAVLDAYGVENALVVGPNSGYDTDNRYLLDTLARWPGRLRGMAVVAQGTSRAELADLAAAGVIGVTMNVPYFGTSFYADAGGLLARLAHLGLYLDLQVEHDQLLELLPMVRASDVRLVIDHCGRPDPRAGVDQPGFRALLDLAAGGRVTVKLSGLNKCSAQPHPYRDAWVFVRALLREFGPDRCVWASDWPFLRAPERIDYGPLLAMVETLVPDTADRRAVLWETPRRLLGLE
jgi:predicted TIM-barrel fold metal-dependent hydrolase